MSEEDKISEEQKVLEPEWQKGTIGSAFIDQLQDMMHEVVVREMKDITRRIDTLCSMGILQDDADLQSIKDKLSQLDVRNKNNEPIDK